MHKYLLIILFLVLIVSLPICFGQDRKSDGQLLVSRYLGSASAGEREEVLKKLEDLGASFDEVREWVRIPENYTSQQSGIHRELAPVGEKKGEYFAYIPPSYVPDKSWPVVLALHGVGGSGYGQVMAWLKSSAHKNEFIFVAPTYGSGLWWEEEPERFVLSVLDKVKQDYHVDTNRVYLTGFSSGGHGVWYVAVRYPSLFAAINPVAAECPLPSLLVNLMQVPVFIIHGARDTVIPVEAARDANSRLEKLGYNVIYEELPELKHQFPANETDQILVWFRTHKRSLYPKMVKFSTDSPKYPVSYWTEITEFSKLVGQVSGVYRDVSGRLVRPEGFSETATIEAEIRKDNEISLTVYGVNALRLYLGEELIDMEKPVCVSINGKTVYSGKMERSVQTMLDTVKKRNDREALFSAYLELKVPSDD
ncbi:MAG: hypothetical protein DYG83_09320 [Candidatus Brocadia sp. AMX2]|uniref:Phospholipase/carboxylesterase/thioesterase domain-containing protein n=1 Tax=Candidatus Brocadia sinica JPN1 TaxID=1197129 RepID=A0ABQ0K1T0_9BACT|nr:MULTISPECIES: PHB depolymerase family esterase [Brocadia]KXK30758.1 MAG: putative phospholipase/carboxylesterase [Candidatus Brocadia sinica]MBC6932566.1 hypothetical protein [Candidatus Brocadia sp.]MBL1168100.1 hypothetical protein [Candidatus Brocadia sp. AMX1]NOG42682.1 hypothetical protein [Planctomycetota bacterium]KAA0243970.1 MAG: hypothetical protein EDM70_08175 [Candidatus Brocadia sp. AMX2]